MLRGLLKKLRVLPPVNGPVYTMYRIEACYNAKRICSFILPFYVTLVASLIEVFKPALSLWEYHYYH